MSYIPTDWKTGDIVSSERMNKIQNGIMEYKGQILVVNMVGENFQELSLNKTWKQINDATCSICKEPYYDYVRGFVNTFSEEREGTYLYGAIMIPFNTRDQSIYIFAAQSENDYPTFIRVYNSEPMQ